LAEQYKAAQAAIKHKPPKGVIAPKKVKLLRASIYRDPENNSIPNENRMAAQFKHLLALF
jgi:hypothetical protein